jgi:molecular chaperone GrpE
MQLFMGKVNGRSQVERDSENSALDLEHELTSGDGGGGSPGESPSAGELSAQETEVQALKAERDSLLDRLKRAQAEFENARRRASKEQQDYRDYATADAIKSLLPVMDSFERALQTKSDAAEFHSGVELIYKQLQSALAKLSVNVLEAKGQPFDPHYHEAIEMVETTEVPDHQVVEELQRGYKFRDRLLRPAMVKVAKNPGK